MMLSSTEFANEAHIPGRFTCDGESVHPALEIADVPPTAKSLALILDDPDAPSGRFVHWTVWNIDPATERIAEGTVPPGAVEGTTSARKPGYAGPCPPSGTHRYFFKLYALDTDLPLRSSATVAALEDAVNGHVVAYAELMGRYSRG